MTDAQFIDYLFQERSEYKETPGFRLFMIGWIAAVSEEGLNAGEEAPMLHMAYTAGQHQAIARTWTDERPTEPGEYWLSMPPGDQYHADPRCRSVYVYATQRCMMTLDFDATGAYEPVLVVGGCYDDSSVWPDSSDTPIAIDDRVFDNAKWSRRETPADPFEEVTT